jgi:DNA-binding MarR family transcriptional regulator
MKRSGVLANDRVIADRLKRTTLNYSVASSTVMSARPLGGDDVVGADAIVVSDSATEDLNGAMIANREPRRSEQEPRWPSARIHFENKEDSDSSLSRQVRYDVGMRDRSQAVRPHELLDPVLDFLRLLWRIEHGLQSTSKRMGTSIGITGPQRLVLKIVSQFPGISASEVAHVVRLHPSTLTGVFQRLVDKGLLVRGRDPIDSRRVRLRVSATAKRFTSASRGTVESAVEAALRRVPAAHVRRAREVLLAVANALDSGHGE